MTSRDQELAKVNSKKALQRQVHGQTGSATGKHISGIGSGFKMQGKSWSPSRNFLTRLCFLNRPFGTKSSIGHGCLCACMHINPCSVHMWINTILWISMFTQSVSTCKWLEAILILCTVTHALHLLIQFWQESRRQNCFLVNYIGKGFAWVNFSF